MTIFTGHLASYDSSKPLRNLAHFNLSTHIRSWKAAGRDTCTPGSAEWAKLGTAACPALIWCSTPAHGFPKTKVPTSSTPPRYSLRCCGWDAKVVLVRVALSNQPPANTRLLTPQFLLTHYSLWNSFLEASFHSYLSQAVLRSINYFPSRCKPRHSWRGTCVHAGFRLAILTSSADAGNAHRRKDFMPLSLTRVKASLEKVRS